MFQRTSQSPRHGVTVRRTAVRTAAVFASLVAMATVAVGQDVGGLAEKLAELRANVEQLSQQLSEEQNEQRERLRSLSRQKADLELEQNREELRLTKLRSAIADKKKEMAEQQERSEQFGPLFDAHVGNLRGYVENSLPFRRSERLASLDKIEEQKKAGLIPPERAVSRLWSFVEDELRLTRESGLYKQTITLDGDERMVDVVRVGMVAIYFRTADDAVGHSVRQGGGWAFREVSDPDAQVKVLELFDQFKKQIRVGYFELPNALPMEH